MTDKLTESEPAIEGVAPDKPHETRTSNDEPSNTTAHEKEMDRLTHLNPSAISMAYTTNKFTASEPAIESMPSDKSHKPVTFLTLARELRQDILLQSYDVTEFTTQGFFLLDAFMSEFLNAADHLHFDKWRFRDHKDRIEKWCSALHAIDADPSFRQDIEYVGTKWVEELWAEKLRREMKMEKYWKIHANWGYTDEVWESTREG